MRFSNLVVAATAAASAQAQRPSDMPICDYYTKALLKENTAKNQATLLTLLVNTVVIGNYTMPNTGVKVAGILAPGNVNGTDVNLAPYFTGALASSNRNDKPVAINFLDGGAAEPLKKNMPANDDSSNQYFLLTHLYQFFGSLLGCSMQGMAGFDAYTANPSMYTVHKYMDLDYAEVTYFITQVAMAAKSFGVADDDITAVGKSLNSIFNVRCGPETAVIPSQGKQLQSICIDPDTCPKAENATCDAYMTPKPPMNATMTASMSSMAPTNMPTGTMSMPSGTSSPSSVPTGAANANGFSLAAVVAGIAAFAL